MKKQFLKQLNRELRPLKKEERIKCLNNYEEIILDKMENGITEENAVSDLGNVKQIAKDILNSYVESDGKMISSNHKYFNKIYIVFDTVVLAGSYISVYYLYFKSGFFETGTWSFPFSEYMSFLLFIIPCYLILYHIFKLYTIKYVQEKYREAWNIFLANVIGVSLISLVMYLNGQIHFSRIMIVIFFCINTILEIIARNVIINCFDNF